MKKQHELLTFLYRIIKENTGYFRDGICSSIQYLQHIRKIKEEEAFILSNIIKYNIDLYRKECNYIDHIINKMYPPDGGYFWRPYVKLPRLRYLKYLIRKAKEQDL